jgi:hypothetical protein
VYCIIFLPLRYVHINKKKSPPKRAYKMGEKLLIEMERYLIKVCPISRDYIHESAREGVSMAEQISMSKTSSASNLV